MPKITIVDENDNVVGAAERYEAWSNGLPHRIVRIFVVRDDDKILLHKRAANVDDNKNKWDQSAGGHVDEGEDYEAAARRETLEELCIQPSSFRSVGKMYVERPLPNNGLAKRFIHVFIAQLGNEDQKIIFDQREIAAIGWYTIAEINAWLARKPEDFTSNFPKAFALVKKHFEQNKT